MGAAEKLDTEVFQRQQETLEKYRDLALILLKNPHKVKKKCEKSQSFVDEASHLVLVSDDDDTQMSVGQKYNRFLGASTII